MVAVELSRLLRRGLFVAAVAAAGWLLSVLFAANASAEDMPGTDGTTSPTQSQSGGGLLGGVLGGVTTTLAGLTDTVSDVTGTVLGTTADATSSLLTPTQPPASEPVLDLPQLLPSLDGSSGSATTDRDVTAPKVETPAPAPVVAPPPVVAPEPTTAVPPAPPASQPAPVVRADENTDDRTDQSASADQQAGHGTPKPRPVKVPATPAGPATTAAPAHDSPGAGRSTHGVLPAHATLHPADAGFTARSRAVDAAGRGVGLPASSPD